MNCVKLTAITGLENNEYFKFATNSFNGCSSLTTMKISRTQTEIPKGSFQGCSKLNLVFHDGITKIDSNAFTNTGLTELVLPSELTELVGSSFNQCQELTTVDFRYAQTLTTIGDNAFSGCPKLSTVLFSTKIKIIGTAAFKNCDILQLSLPNALVTLNSEAFASNTHLTEAAFFSYQQSLGSNIFNGCTSLTKLSFTGEIVSPFPENIFDGIPNLKEILYCGTWAPHTESTQLQQYTNLKVNVKTDYNDNTFFGVEITASQQSICQAMNNLPTDPPPKDPPPPIPEPNYCYVDGESVFSPDGCNQNNNENKGKNETTTDNTGKNETTTDNGGKNEKPEENIANPTPTSNPDDSKLEGKSKQTAIIAGSVVAVVAVVVIVAVVAVFVIRSKKASIKTEGDIEP